MPTEISSQLSDAIKINDLPVAKEGKKSLWCLWYRERRNPHPQTKYFFFEGDLRAAIARGRSHCEQTNLVFIHVRPFLSDLAVDEQRHFGNAD
jgi:hypothetical protein